MTILLSRNDNSFTERYAGIVRSTDLGAVTRLPQSVELSGLEDHAVGNRGFVGACSFSDHGVLLRELGDAGLVAEAVIGYYTLAVGQVARDEAPERVTKGLARHPVPIMLLARLAVSRGAQGQGVGKALLRDAMRRTLQAADIAGIRAFAVHAKDDAARRFYENFDFIPSPSDPMHLFVLLKDVRRSLPQ